MKRLLPVKRLRMSYRAESKRESLEIIVQMLQVKLHTLPGVFRTRASMTLDSRYRTMSSSRARWVLDIAKPEGTDGYIVLGRYVDLVGSIIRETSRFHCVFSQLEHSPDYGISFNAIGACAVLEWDRCLHLLLMVVSSQIKHMYLSPSLKAHQSIDTVARNLLGLRLTV